MSREADETTAIARMARLAERYDGVLAVRHMLACGISRSTIARWERIGRIHRIYPGVYAIGHRALTRAGELTAALFYTSRGSALGYCSGLHHWELVEAAPERIQLVSLRAHRPQPGLEIHRVRAFAPVIHRRLPVVPVPLALRQAATEIPLIDIRRALSEASFRNVLDPLALVEEIGRGRPGSARLRLAWERHEPRLALTESELELEFFLLVERAGLPLPEPNYPISRMRVDAAWPDRMHATELDGRAAHEPADRRERDLGREMRLRRLGWTVSRYSWSQVKTQPEGVIADLRRCLGDP